MESNHCIIAKALSDLQQDDRWQAVMPFRLGYPAQDALPSPRRAVVSALIQSPQGP